MFTSIFSYVEHLFTKIKPRKVFFMAVDGVAPRAKMNQQRSRRFRTAKEAQEMVERATRNGEKLPDQKAFDSNCITPGKPAASLLGSPDLNTCRDTVHGTPIAPIKVFCKQEDIRRFQLARCPGRPLGSRSPRRRRTQNHRIHQIEQSAAGLQPKH